MHMKIYNGCSQRPTIVSQGALHSAKRRMIPYKSPDVDYGIIRGVPSGCIVIVPVVVVVVSVVVLL